MKRKLVSILCAVFLLTLLLPQFSIGAEASSTSASGYCGDNLKWSFSGSSLTITGSGKMYDYASYSNTPWNTYSYQIEKITIGDQVESIGNNAFAYFSNLKTVTVSNPIQAKIVSIGTKAFYYCRNLTTVTGLPSSLRNIYTSAFEGCSAITSASFYATSSVWRQVVTVGSYNTALTSKMTYGTQTHPNHPVCGLTCTCSDTSHPSFYWNAWNGTGSTDSYYKYYLSADVVRSGRYTFSGSGTSTICLNGHTIETNGDAIGFNIASGAALLITDCGTTGELSSNDGSTWSTSSEEYAIYNLGTFTLYNGKLNGGNASIHNEEDATLNVYGGTVVGDDQAIWNYGTANLYGGRVDCSAGDAIWNSGGVMTIDGTEFVGSISNSGTAEIISGTLRMESGYAGISNTGTMTIYDIDVSFADGVAGNVVEANNGTLHIRGGNFPASMSQYGSQYYGLAVRYSNARVYVSGTPNLEAVYVAYPNTLYFRSSDGKSNFLTDKTLKFRAEPYYFGNTGIAASNVSGSVWDHVVQINSSGEAGTDDGELTYESGNIKFAKTLYSGKCGDALYWKLDGNGKVTIYGTGDMYDYTSSSTPWYSYRSQIKKVVFEEGCTYIGNNAFMYCENLSEIDFGNNTMTMGDYCFGCCYSLKSVNVPAGVQLGYCAFHYCTGLQSAVVACPELSKFAFELCKNLTSIELKDTVTTITYGALRRTDSLKSVTFPASVQYVDEYIFANNSNGSSTLTDITFLSNTTQISAGMLNYMTPGNITIHADACSTAAVYARKVGAKFEAFANGVDHTPEDVEGVEATCTQKGKEAGSVCAVCEIVISGCEEIPVAGHSFTNYITDGQHVCGQEGTRTAKCDNCEETHTENVTFDHEFAEYVYNQDATCTEDGTKTAKCEYCTEEDTVEAIGSMLGHNYEAVVTEPQCESAGYTTHTCENCGDEYTDSETTKLGHSFTKYESNNDATCTADGTKTAKCDRCEETDTVTETDSMKGHAWGDWTVVTPAGCTTDGEERRDCADCEAFETNVLTQTNHSYKSVVTEPQCESAGYTTHTCENCGDEYTDSETTKLGHSFTEYKSNNDATCTADGTKTAKCDRCEETDTVIETDSMKDHAWGDWTVVTPAGCTTDGEERRDCTDCEAFETNVLTQTGHSYKSVVTEPQCESAGYTTHTCENCGDEYTDSETTKLGHSFTKYESNNDATCTADGTKTAKCDRCEETDTVTETDSMKDHTWGDWEVTKAPAILHEGEETRKCTGCDLTESRSVDKRTNPFVDVLPGSFYEIPVFWAVDNGITNGVDATHFAPDKICNRAEVVTFLWRSVGSPAPESDHNPFEDVKEGTFYYKAVLWAVENGITKGTDATHFSPYTECSRGQVATFLWRALGEPKPANPDNPFTDCPAGEYYCEAVLWAAENGITNGTTETTFEPYALCNRGQIVTFLYRAMK